MKLLFDYDSPIIQFLNKITDLIVLNILAVICSIPIITVGAAITALTDAVKRLHNEEGNIYRKFFVSFASNFKQATIIWLLAISLLMLLLGSFFLSYFKGYLLLMVFSCVALLLWIIVLTWTFLMQAFFSNTILGTLKNALLCGISYFPKTVLMILLNFAPVLYLTGEIFSIMGLISLLIWFSLAASLNIRLARKPFEIIQSHFDNSKDNSPAK